MMRDILSILDVDSFFGEDMNDTSTSDSLGQCVTLLLAASGLGGGTLNHNVGAVGRKFASLKTDRAGDIMVRARVMTGLGQTCGQGEKIEGGGEFQLHCTSNTNRSKDGKGMGGRRKKGIGKRKKGRRKE
jgi:hypothetical protein